MAKPTSTMKSFMDVLKQYQDDTKTSGIAILDHAVRAVSGFKDLQTAIDSFVEAVAVPYVDPKTQTEAQKEEAKIEARRRLEENCGIILGPDNNFAVDTGAVSGSNAKNGETKDAQSIVPETGDKKIRELPTVPYDESRITKHYYLKNANGDGYDKEHFFYIQWPKEYEVVDRKWQTFDTYDPTKWTREVLIDGKEYYSDPKHEKTYTGSMLKESIDTITKGMYYWWAEESAKLAYESYGVDFDGKKLKVEFLVNQANLQADTGPEGKKENDTTPADVITMTFSLANYGIIDKDDVNGKTRVTGGFPQCYLDRTVAHEMIHAVMQGSGTLKSYDKGQGVGMPEFFTEGIAELVMGLDDFDAGNTATILNFAQNKEGLKKAMVLASGTGTEERYTSGYMFLRYLCEQGLQKNPSAVADVGDNITEYYDKDGNKLTGPAGAVITIDGRPDQDTYKRVTVTGAVNGGIRIDLSDANVYIKDETGTTVFTLNGSLISGKEFFVSYNRVLQTREPLTVWEGSIITNDAEGNFDLKADSVIEVQVEGKSTTTINGVPFAVTNATKKGVTFRKRGGIVEAELDAKGESLTVGGFKFEVGELSAAIGVYVDELGSHVTGLVDGDKIIITKGDLTATYTADGGGLEVEYTDGSSTTKKSYSRGDWNILNTTWDGKVEPVVGAGLNAGTVIMGGKEMNSVVDGALVDAQGNVTTDEDKAVATIERERGSLNYRSKDTSRAQEITITDTNGVNWNIDTSASGGRTLVDVGVIRDNKGDFQGSRSVNEAVNFTAGSGKSEVAIYSDANSSIQGGAGNLIAAVGGKGDHHVTAGSGSKNVLKDFGSGENVLVGGSGKNTFESDNEKGTLVAGSGENIFQTTKGVTNKIEGYTFGRDEVSIGSAVAYYNKFNVGEGTINYDGKTTNGEVDVSSGTGTGNAYMVTMADSTGYKTRVGWTGEDGGTVDVSAETKPFVLIGNQNKDAKDILIGGTGNDIIFAGENDSVTGGAGRNQIHLLSGSCKTVGFGTAGAKDEVAGFVPGFDDSGADTIYLMDASVTDNLNLKYENEEVVLKSDSASMKLVEITKSQETKAAELLIGGTKVAVIEKGTTATVSETDYADVYYGMGSANLDFKAVSDDLTVDLSDENRFRNIKTVTGGKEKTILMGGSGKTTLVSGGGNTSLWGGTGNAKLVGARDARDEFFFFGESGKDTISGFAAGTGDTSDVLNFYGSGVTNLKGTDAGVEVSTSETSRLSIQGIKANDKLQWESGEAKGVAKVGSSSKANTFIYDDEVTNYFGGSKTDTLKVSGVSNSVWLEKIGSSIEIMDASASTGVNILAGGREAETIKGGGGNNSIWGGAGGNDVLTGGSNYNEFYFGMGEGADTITKSNDGDKVMLYNIKLEDLNPQAVGLQNGSMVIGLKDGSTLTIQNYDRHGATTFQLADGKFSYDRNTGTWQERK